MTSTPPQDIRSAGLTLRPLYPSPLASTLADICIQLQQVWVDVRLHVIRHVVMILSRLDKRWVRLLNRPTVWRPEAPGLSLEQAAVIRWVASSYCNRLSIQVLIIRFGNLLDYSTRNSASLFCTSVCAQRTKQGSGQHVSRYDTGDRSAYPYWSRSQYNSPWLG